MTRGEIVFRQYSHYYKTNYTIKEVWRWKEFSESLETTVRKSLSEELNKGVIPEGIDVHWLAGLIKAWFRELPRGVLDPLPSQQVIQCESEEDFVKVVRLLPQTEASLLNWTINLMADIVEFEHVNKMSSRNLALVFAPNMSQMADPLTALMYAVQVMNLLKNLTDKTLRERKIVSSQVDQSGNVSEAEDGDVEEYNQEIMFSFGKENEDVDHLDKEDEKIVEEESKRTIHCQMMNTDHQGIKRSKRCEEKS